MAVSAATSGSGGTYIGANKPTAFTPRSTVDDPIIQFEVITDWADLCHIESEWKILWNDAKRAFALQSFEAADIIRRIPLRRRKTRLWCLVGRVEGTLACVWPFVTYHNHGWRLATPLASDFDCSDPLVLKCTDYRNYVQSAWAYALRTCPCDLFHLQFVRQNMPLSDIVAQTPSRVLIYELKLPLVDFPGSWNSYEKGLSKKQHQGFARKRRRLLELGNVHFELLPYNTPGIAEWLIVHKKKWLAKTGWDDRIQLTRPQYVDFLRALLCDLGPDGRCRVFAIKQGERLIAVDINLVDQHTMQWYVGTFDEDFGKYSPGQLLKEFVVRWALEHRLMYDMLGGTGQHKNYLATKIERVTTWRVGRTIWGHCYVDLRRSLVSAGLLRVRPESYQQVPNRAGSSIEEPMQRTSRQMEGHHLQILASP